MYKIKAKKGVQILIGDLNTIISDTNFVEISEEKYKKSNDLKKVEKYLVFEKDIKDEFKTEEQKDLNNKIYEKDLNNKIYVKNLNDINDDIVIEEQIQYEKFVIDHNLNVVSIKNNVIAESNIEDVSNIEEKIEEVEVKTEEKIEKVEVKTEDIKEKSTKRVKKPNKEDSEVKKSTKKGSKPKQNKKSQDDDIKK